MDLLDDLGHIASSCQHSAIWNCRCSCSCAGAALHCITAIAVVQVPSCCGALGCVRRCGEAACQSGALGRPVCQQGSGRSATGSHYAGCHLLPTGAVLEAGQTVGCRNHKVERTCTWRFCFSMGAHSLHGRFFGLRLSRAWMLSENSRQEKSAGLGSHCSMLSAVISLAHTEYRRWRPQRVHSKRTGRGARGVSMPKPRVRALFCCIFATCAACCTMLDLPFTGHRSDQGP